MAWIFASVVLVLLVVSPGFRKFFFGTILVLSIAGFLLYSYQQYINREKTSAHQSRPLPNDRDTVDFAAWGRSQPPQAAPGRDFSKELFGEPTSSALPAVIADAATPEEATQAIKRLREKDLRRVRTGEKRAFSGQQATVSPPPASSSPQQTTTALSPSTHAPLSSDENDSLELACFFAKSQGPAAYNACRSSHIAMLANAPPRPNLSQVSGEERESLELACFHVKSQGPSTYNQCLSNHLRQLSTAPRHPNLNGLTPDEHQSIELACFRAKSQGPASYNSCLHAQLAKLSGR